jgi:hypothetical protein
MVKLIPKTSDLTFEAERIKVINLLNQFMMEMNLRELSCLKELKDLDLEFDALTVKEMKFLSDLESRYRRYCTRKKRKYNRLRSYGIPTNYDPSIEKIVEVVFENRNSIIVLSQREFGIKTQHKYVVLRRNQKWLIDNRQRLEQDGRWRKVVL